MLMKLIKKIEGEQCTLQNQPQIKVIKIFT